MGVIIAIILLVVAVALFLLGGIIEDLKKENKGLYKAARIGLTYAENTSILGNDYIIGVMERHSLRDFKDRPSYDEIKSIKLLIKLDIETINKAIEGKGE